MGRRFKNENELQDKKNINWSSTLYSKTYD